MDKAGYGILEKLKRIGKEFRENKKKGTGGLEKGEIWENLNTIKENIEIIKRRNWERLSYGHWGTRRNLGNREIQKL